MKKKIKSVGEALADLGKLYESRNAVYGSAYKQFGPVMRGFFPTPPKLETPEDWNRLSLFFHIADKLKRYANNFNKGGHVDSLDDISCYAAMLQEYDAETRDASKR